MMTKFTVRIRDQRIGLAIVGITLQIELTDRRPPRLQLLGLIHLLTATVADNLDDFKDDADGDFAWAFLVKTDESGPLLTLFRRDSTNSPTILSEHFADRARHVLADCAQQAFELPHRGSDLS